MPDLYEVRVQAVEGKCLCCRVTELYGQGYDLANSRTLAFGFLWDTTEWGWWMRQVPEDAADFTKEGLQARARATPLGQALEGFDFYSDRINRRVADRIVSCVGVVDRVNHGRRATDEEDEPDERPEATYLIAVTDGRWIEHLAPGMTWGSRVWNRDRPVAFNPAWRSSDVTLLATDIYDERAFDQLPILADALQDAGCDSDDLLNHLRDPNATHVRGCWALDLVLGKE